jgi:hypothetical protein
MTDLIAPEAHRNLAEAKRSFLPTEGHLQLHLLNLAGLEHPVELRAELLRGLPGEHLEHLAAYHLVTSKSWCADLALAVPYLDAIIPVDDVETHRQAVDDEAGEPALLVDLPRLRRHLDCQIGGEGERSQKRCQQVGDDFKDLHAGRVECASYVQEPDLSLFVLQGEPHGRAAVRDGVQRLDERGIVQWRSRNHPETAGFLVAEPDAHRLRGEANPECLGHRGKGLLDGKPSLQQLGHPADVTEW